MEQAEALNALCTNQECNCLVPQPSFFAHCRQAIINPRQSLMLTILQRASACIQAHPERQRRHCEGL